MPLGAAFYDVLKVIDQLKQNGFVGFKGSSQRDICPSEDQYYSSREDVIPRKLCLDCGDFGLQLGGASVLTNKPFLKKIRRLILFSRICQKSVNSSFEDPKTPDAFQRLLQGDIMSSISPNGNVAESQTLDMSSLDASFICSGPFRLMMTCLPERHLHLDADGILHIYLLPKTDLWWSFYRPPRLTIFEDHFFWNHENAASG
jgi:hypothetical protein